MQNISASENVYVCDLFLVLMVYLYHRTSCEIVKGTVWKIISVYISLSTVASRGNIKMKIAAAFLVIFVIRVCTGQTNPMAWSRDQRVIKNLIYSQT